jgi:membrane protein YdbS with pleckstrin-like domain
MDATVVLDGSEHNLDPRVRILWAVNSALIGVGVGVAGAIVCAVAGGPGWLTALSLVAGLAFAAVGILTAGAVWRRWRWRALDDALELRHGLVVVHESLVPYRRIQQIDIERGPIERWLELSTLMLRTAAATTDAKIPGIPAAHAAGLRELLLERAGLDDAV